MANLGRSWLLAVWLVRHLIGAEGGVRYERRHQQLQQARDRVERWLVLHGNRRV